MIYELCRYGFFLILISTFTIIASSRRHLSINLATIDVAPETKRNHLLSHNCLGVSGVVAIPMVKNKWGGVATREIFSPIAALMTRTFRLS